MKRRTYGPLVAARANGRLWGTPGNLFFLREVAMLTHVFPVLGILHLTRLKLTNPPGDPCTAGRYS